jgi:PAS domain-containing protein
LPITRRSLLAAAASVTLAPAAGRPTQPADAELTALGARFEQALGALDAAQRAFNDCECRYLEEGPDPPPMLTRAGALGILLRHEGEWCRAHELRWLLKDDDHRADWPAARAALRVALAYEARDRRFRRKLGLRAAERAQRAALDAIDDLAAAILAAPAGLAQGLAVQGRAVKAFGKPEWWSGEASHADACERFAAHRIDRAIAAAG